ncbi:MAG: MBL fold metallo-hydrolase [Oscillospiraceae bacterium]|nr:MBL fold metallo-hydrolase [Oscillospiraceae bacterium]
MKKALFSFLAALLCVILWLLFPSTEEMDMPEATIPSATIPSATIPKATTADGEAALTIHFIDVGQADCALLESGGEYMIIDGGNVDDGQMIVSYLKQHGIDSLSAVVCSHAHEDHVGGLPAILSVFKTDAVYAPVNNYDTKVFTDFVSKTKNQGLKVTIPTPGDKIPFGDVDVTVLGPVKKYEDPNNTSIILKVSCGESDFLFTGDMEVLAENDMLDYWDDRVDWNVELLKVGHHGSETSSGYRLVYETNPTYGIISVGEDNSYDHPHEKPMSRLKDAGVLLLRTDLLGHVIVQTDGSEITITWENQNAAPEDAIPAEPEVLYGNKKSKKLHTSDCNNAPSAQNRVEFSDYDEAIAAGYDPCDSCIG